MIPLVAGHHGLISVHTNLNIHTDVCTPTYRCARPGGCQHDTYGCWSQRLPVSISYKDDNNNIIILLYVHSNIRRCYIILCRWTIPFVIMLYYILHI